MTTYQITETKILKKDGRIIHTAHEWDSERNRTWNKARLEAIHGPLKWEDGEPVKTQSI